MDANADMAVNKNAIADPNAAQNANDVDAMQAKINELKNLWINICYKQKILVQKSMYQFYISHADLSYR